MHNDFCLVIYLHEECESCRPLEFIGVLNLLFSITLDIVEKLEA